MEQQQLQHLLEKYLAGQCTEEEKKTLDAWYASFEKKEGYIEKLDPTAKKHLEDKLLAKIHTQIKINTKTPVRNAPSRQSLYKVAAVFGLLALGMVSILLLSRPGFTEYQTAYGETRQIILPDSSTIILNAHSTIRFKPTWDQQTDREIWMDGEAYFSVKHKANHQHFVVHTDDLEVEVLGTEFNVNTRDATTRVVLNKGKVKLNMGLLAEEKEVVMIPGELVEFSGREKKLTKKTVDVEMYTSWRNHELIFRETTLEEIARVLEATYGLEVQIDSALAKEKFTGTFASDKVSVLLTAIAEVHQARITRNGQKITIDKK